MASNKILTKAEAILKKKEYDRKSREKIKSYTEILEKLRKRKISIFTEKGKRSSKVCKCYEF